MSIILNDNLSIQAPKSADSRYGPYADTATAIASVTAANRYQGLVVGISGSGSIVEYWWRDGTADANLILKVEATANTASANTIYLQSALNTTNANISAAFAQANATAGGLVSANANVTILFGIENTQNNNISAAFAQANTAYNNTVYLQGALNTSNTNASSNLIYLQTVNNNQNTTIQAAFNAANIGSSFVNSGGSISGNVSITGNLAVTGSISYTGNVTTQVISGNTGQFYGYPANGFNALYAGIPTGYFVEPQMVEQITSNFNGYSGGINMQNINSGTQASMDLFITADNGTVNDGYIDLGLASSTYNYPGYNLIGRNDAYFFVTGNTTTGGGNMIIGTGAPNDIIFTTNGINTTNEVGRFKNNVGLVLKNVPIVFTDGTGQNTAAAPFAYTNASFSQANTAAANTIYLQGALNTSNTNASANLTYLQGVNTSQNTNISIVSSNTAAAFNLANATAGGLVTANANTVLLFGYVNTANANIAAAFAQANVTAGGLITANANISAAFALANATAGGLVTANANTTLLFGYVTTANANITAAFTQANTAYNNTIYINGVDSTQNANISAAFSLANATAGGLITANANTVYLSGALATANANTVYLQGGLNTANANTVLLFGYVNTANANIAAAFAQANAANILAQAAFNKANTGGSGSSSGYLPSSIIFANTTGYLSNTSNLSFYSSNNILAVSGMVTANYIGFAGSQNSAVTISGTNTKGGVGYVDFLNANNISTGANYTNKWFRLDSNGQLQIINSAYSTNIFNLNDSGVLSVPSFSSVTLLQGGGGQITFAECYQIYQGADVCEC